MGSERHLRSGGSTPLPSASTHKEVAFSPYAHGVLDFPRRLAILGVPNGRCIPPYGLGKWMRDSDWLPTGPPHGAAGWNLR